MSITTDLLDRIHVLNQSIVYDQLQASRYFDGNLRPPYITAYIRPATHQRNDTDLYSVRTIGLAVILGAVNEGIVTKTMQRHSEEVIDPILNVYGKYRYLQTDTLQGLSFVSDDVQITQDSGIVFSQLTGRLQIEFTLSVPIWREIS